MAAGTTDPRFGLYLLGRVVFLRHGEPVKLSHQALKTLALLVLNGSSMHRDAMVGYLWPDARVASGRHQLRNLLTALRAAGLTVERQGEAVVIRDDVYCDVQDFMLSAGQALAGGHGRDECLRRCLLAQSLWARGGVVEPWRYESWAIKGPPSRGLVAAAVMASGRDPDGPRRHRGVSNFGGISPKSLTPRSTRRRQFASGAP